MKKLSSLTFPLLVVGFMTGCTSLGPDFTTPNTETEKEWLNYEKKDLGSTPPLQVKWWQDAFHDKTLNKLVDTSLKENLTLRSAGLRVMQSRQKLAIAIGDQYPQTQEIQGGASTGAPMRSSTTQQYGTSFNLSWETDVWGRFSRQIESASAELNATVADYDGVMISLISDVAQTYYSIRTNESRLKLAKKNLVLQKESLRITEAKFQAGEVSALDQKQAETLLYNTEASISILVPRIQQYKNSLAILMGKPPHDMKGVLGRYKPVPVVSGKIALGMPQNLIRRRPDIRSSERRLAAQSAQIGYAITDLYPTFAVGGTIGTNATNQGSNLFSSDYSNWSSFVSFQWNIFNYGRIKSNVRLQDALFQQELEDYRQTVLEAQGEVENAIVAFFGSEKQIYAYNKAVIASKEAAVLARLQYEDGLVNYNTVITTLQTLAVQEDTLAQTRGDAVYNLIEVYKSLGGGWEIRNNRLPDQLLSQATFNEMLKRTEYWKDQLPNGTTQQ